MCGRALHRSVPVRPLQTHLCCSTGRNDSLLRSGPLLEHLLAQQGDQVLVAAVPVLETHTSKHVEQQQDSEDTDSIKLKEIATAARVLQVSRNTQVSSLSQHN